MKKIEYLRDGRFVQIEEGPTQGIDEVAKRAYCPHCKDANQRIVAKFHNDPQFPNIKWWLECPVHGPLWFVRSWEPVSQDHRALAQAGAWFGR